MYMHVTASNRVSWHSSGDSSKGAPHRKPWDMDDHLPEWLVPHYVHLANQTVNNVLCYSRNSYLLNCDGLHL